MAAPNPEWYDSGDVLLSAAFSLGNVIPGANGSATELRLYNNKGGVGADDLLNAYVRILGRNNGETVYLASGREVVDLQQTEARIVSGLGGLVVSPGPWRALGAGRRFELPAIPNDQGLKMEFRASPPAGANDSNLEISVSLETSPALPVPDGLSEAHGDGLNLGLFDRNVTHLLSSAGDVVENGPVDDVVEVQDLVYVYEGVPGVELKQDVQFDEDDGSAVALASGEAYYGLLYVDSGGLQSAKGDKATSPLDDSDKPALPAGAIPICWVLREFDALIHSADIDNVSEQGAGAFTSSGLSATVGPRMGLVANRRIRSMFGDAITLTASSTNYVWQLEDGSMSVTTTSAAPEPTALLLWEATTDGSGVTGLVDRRPFVAMGFREQIVEFRFDGAISVSDGRYAAVASLNQDAYVIPLRALAMWIGDSGATSGDTKADINYSDDGGALTTLFTSQGSEDRRPTIAYDSTTKRDFAGLPEVLTIPAGARLQAVVDAVPGGGAPADLVIAMRLAVM